MLECKCKCGCTEPVLNGSTCRLWTACFTCGAAWLDGARKHGPGATREIRRVEAIKKQMAKAR